MCPRKSSKILTSLLITLALCSLHAQEESLRGIQNNPLPGKKTEKSFFKSVKTDVLPTPIELPVIDDFSGSGLYPDDSIWWDSKSVFINNNFAIGPPTFGTATFDAMDDSGRVYDVALNKTETADILVSRYIKLKGKENIFLSFLYQPGGNGEIPNKSDSLVLQFSTSDSLVWKTVWRAVNFYRDSVVVEILNGDTTIWAPRTEIKAIVNGSDTTYTKPRLETIFNFKNVIIEIDTQLYAKSNFRFRFMNYINLKDSEYEGLISNTSMWHVDYVKLDANRNAGDTILNDIALVNTVENVLKNYVSIPARHFGSDLGINQWTNRPKIYIKNNYNTNIDYNRSLELRDVYLNISNTQNTGAGIGDNIPAMGRISIEDGLENDLFNMRNYLIDEGADSALFDFKYFLTNNDNPGDRKENDTLTYRFILKDYYAYDDGTAEKGYGITGEGTRYAEVAVRFEPLTGSTLHGIYMYFNKPYHDGAFKNKTYFNLTIWNDRSNAPGDTLYSREAQVGYGEGPNQFLYYELEEPVHISKTFYVGWRQIKEEFLNIGFDKYYNNKGRNYVNLGSGWTGSKLEGSIMIRPVFKDLTTNVTEVEKEISFTVYPNPVSGILYIKTGNMDHELPYKVFDMQGRTIKSGITENQSINCSGLKKGIYLFSFETEGVVNHKKIIIAGND